MSKLFSPIQVGPYSLAHRVAMAPLTRMRAEAGDIPGALMAAYYAQRASAGGLIVAEATVVSRTGRGYLGAPGIYADAQIAGWKLVTDAVHAKGGRIFLQLWHVGRQSHSDLQPDGAAPVAPSVVPYEGVAFTANGWVPVTPARALSLAEIANILEDFRRGAERALAAGFDGVEIHGGNGYLPDQFLQDGTNRRSDAYGGPVENRARFLLEATAAAVSVWGADRVAVRIAPSGDWAGMSDGNPEATFGYVAEQLNAFGLAYLHVIEPRIRGAELIAEKDQAPVAAQQLRKIFKGRIIAAGGFTPESAEAIVAAGDADLVAFGRDFIANPDLPERIRHQLPFNPYDRASFYGGDARGYLDYPFHSAELAAA
ncbi:alkene reductase [Rhodoferax sp.]|uniref:alkene reductase n=1 Tax=Rhodoferax sp. TaxID=50421 RepID=UPI00374D9C3C